MLTRMGQMDGRMNRQPENVMPPAMAMASVEA